MSLPRLDVHGYVETMLCVNTCGLDWEFKDYRGAVTVPDTWLEDIGDMLDVFMIYCREEAGAEFEAYMDEHGAQSFGRDYALSRNGHGSGFFDRGMGFPKLQTLASHDGSNVWAYWDGTLEILE